MKRAIALLLTAFLAVPAMVFSQDKNSLKAADLSFDNGSKHYRKENFKEAAQSFEIVVNNIPDRTDSRKYAELKLDAYIQLIDIYYSKSVNLDKACEYLDNYSTTLQKVQSNGVLKGKDLLKYLNMEQDYLEKKKMCENRGTLDERKKKMEKILEKETGGQ
jgi:hypothetical protein